jgi:hypothetical protein
LSACAIVTSMESEVSRAARDPTLCVKEKKLDDSSQQAHSRLYRTDRNSRGKPVDRSDRVAGRRGACRLVVTDTAPGGCRAECSQTAYVVAHTQVRIRRRLHGPQPRVRKCEIGDLEPAPGALVLKTRAIP